MQPIRIIPQYTLVLVYDILPGSDIQEACYRFMVTDFVPALHKMQVYMFNAWHVDYGNYPEWQVEFITEEKAHIERLFQHDEFQRLEDRLLSYTANYHKRVVRYRGGLHV